MGLNVKMKKVLVLPLFLLLNLLVHPEVTAAKTMSAISSIAKAAEHPIVSNRPAVVCKSEAGERNLKGESFTVKTK